MGNVVNIYVVKLLPSLPRTFPEYNLGWADREVQINSEKKKLPQWGNDIDDNFRVDILAL